MQVRKLCGVVIAALCLFFTSVARAQSPGTFAYSGSLTTARLSHTATLLNNGMVLIAGGAASVGLASGAELYNPTTGGFTSTGNLNTPRYLHTATLLNNGMVLITGGETYTNILSSAELYNPATGVFTLTGSLNTARIAHTATLLNNGMVLITGGENGNGSLSSAELYNPATGTFAVTGSLNTSRYSHTATLLNNGLVLVAAGGHNEFGVTSTAELYNPTTGTFAVTGSLNAARLAHTATLLNDGMVLVAGGNGAPPTAELYNPATGVFANTGSMSVARFSDTATLLSNGTVLVTGGIGPFGSGYGPSQTFLASAEVYSPTAGSFNLTGSLNTARESHTSTLLQNGKVLAAGGEGCPTSACSNYALLTSSELYEPTSLTPAGLLSIALSPVSPWVPVGSTEDFVATGTFSGNTTQILSSATWTSSNTAVATITNDSSNSGHADAVASGTTIIEACTGSVCGSTTMTVAPHTNLLLGGNLASGSFETHDDSGNLVNQGTLSPTRSAHSTTLLTNGTVFVAGGQDEDGTWQILNINGLALSSGTLENGFFSHFAVRLANGNVFLGGGKASPGAWEIHNSTGALVSTGSLLGSRTPGAGAVALPNTNIFIAGSGAGTHTDESTWEIHDVNGNLLSNGTLFSPFTSTKMFVLSNGDLVLVGGTLSSSVYEIYTQTGTLVRTGTTINGFDSNAGAVLVNNDVFIFESGYWEFIGFDGNANETFDTTGSLLDSRIGAKAVVTSAGNIFITGGSAASGAWEMYTPSGTTVILHSSGTLFDARDNGHSDTHF